MDRRTARIYERQAAEWVEARAPRRLSGRTPTHRRLLTFAAELPEGARVADLGCGPAWHAAELRKRGLRAVGMDLSHAMLLAAGVRAPGLPLVRAELAALPFARESLDGLWAVNSLGHLPEAELAPALAGLHHALVPGGRLALTLPYLGKRAASEAERRRGVSAGRDETDALPGRLFTFVSRARARALVSGAGFDEVEATRGRTPFWLWLRGARAWTLPDYVRPGLDLLICGLNPSPYAADTGIPFGRPGNRFWPAAARAGLAARERDPWDALRQGWGFTDLVKRTTRSASALSKDEYAAGVERVRDCVEWCQPRVLCFVGLDGWRRAVDRKGEPGWIEGGFGGRPAYLMPSTSGLNARSDLAALAAHLRRALLGP